MYKSIFTIGSAVIFSANISGSVGAGSNKASAKPVNIKADPTCAKLGKGFKTNDTIISNGKVANVFVYVKNAPKAKGKPKGKVRLDQKGCRYNPKVFGIQAKQKREILNSDPTLHNVHAFAKRGEFNQAMPTQGQKLTTL